MAASIHQRGWRRLIQDRAGDVIAAVFAAFAVWWVVTPQLPAHKPHDPYRAKYEQVRAGMTLEEVTRLLGPPADEFHPGGSLGDHRYYWTEDGERHIVVTWNVFGEYADKDYIRR